MMKPCKACGMEKPLEQFQRAPTTKDGHKGKCKDCFNAERRQRYQDNRDIELVQANAWKTANRERHRATSRAYVALHREEINARSIQWAKDNPLKGRQKAMRYYARKKEAVMGNVSYDRILIRDGYVCYLCGLPVLPEDVQFDHIVPLARGGAHTEDNITVTHAVCNKQKGKRLVMEYVRDQRLPNPDRPVIVCLCGSTRFSAAFREANLNETLAGKIVASIGCDMRSDDEIFAHKDAAELAEIKAALDELHLRKIDIADEVLILNCGGYIGQSTARELAYARANGKRVRFLEATT